MIPYQIPEEQEQPTGIRLLLRYYQQTVNNRDPLVQGSIADAFPYRGMILTGTINSNTLVPVRPV